MRKGSTAAELFTQGTLMRRSSRALLHNWMGLWILFAVAATNPSRAADSLQVSNVGFILSKDKVIISYDFLPTAEKRPAGGTKDMAGANHGEYKITVWLKREQDAAFYYLPVNVSGDVGTAVTPGAKKSIIWDLTNEFPDGLQGDDFYFVVLASPVVDRGNRLLWIGATAAAIGAGVAAVLLSHNSGGSSPLKGAFPSPPSRPQ